MAFAYDSFDLSSDDGGSSGYSFYEQVDISELRSQDESPLFEAYSTPHYSVLADHQFSSDDASSEEDDQLTKASEANALLKSQRKREMPLKEDMRERPMDWNEAFQRLVEQEDSYEKYAGLRKLAHDFVFAAATYGKIIISEIALPNERKTIKPIDIGGTAGGEKYIVQGIFFKFALDIHSLYGGDEYAMKAASHDLKGLISYYNCHIEGLCVPLMALIDFMGFRLIAISILPIDKSTLCYGSCDGGHSVEKKFPECNAMFEAAARIMKIKTHRVGILETGAKDLAAPVDIEGHRGLDHRYYVLDFARCFPPEQPTPESIRRKGSILYRLLRPELVRSNAKPLSPDAWSYWSRVDPRKEEHNGEVREATQRLYQEVIPAFAKHIDDEASKMDKDWAGTGVGGATFSFVELLHSRGINVRHLGHLRTHVTHAGSRASILTEMVARVVKNFVRTEFRGEVRNATSRLSEEPLRGAVAYVYNIILGSDVDRAGIFWHTEVKHKICEKFHTGLTPEESDDSYDLSGSLDVYALVCRIQRLLCVNLSPSLIAGVRDYTDGGHHVSPRVVLSDIIDFRPRLKHMNLVDMADATALLYEARESVEVGTKMRLLARALEKYIEASRKHPCTVDTFLRIGEELYALAAGDPSPSKPAWGHQTHQHVRTKARSYAIQAYQHGLAVEPESSACIAAIAAAMHLAHPKSRKETITKCKEALALDESCALAYHILGEIYIDDGHYEDAIKMCDAAMHHRPCAEYMQRSLVAKVEQLLKEIRYNNMDMEALRCRVDELFHDGVSKILNDINAEYIPIPFLARFWAAFSLILKKCPLFQKVVEYNLNQITNLRIETVQFQSLDLPLLEELLSYLPHLSGLEICHMPEGDEEETNACLSNYLQHSTKDLKEIKLIKWKANETLIRCVAEPMVGERLTHLSFVHVEVSPDADISAMTSSLINLKHIHFEQFSLPEDFIIALVRSNGAHLRTFEINDCYVPGALEERTACATDELIESLPECIEVLGLSGQTRPSKETLHGKLILLKSLTKLNVKGCEQLDVMDLVTGIPDHCRRLVSLITPSNMMLKYAGEKSAIISCTDHHGRPFTTPSSIGGASHSMNLSVSNMFTYLKVEGHTMRMSHRVSGTTAFAQHIIEASLPMIHPFLRVTLQKLGGGTNKITTNTHFSYLNDWQLQKFGGMRTFGIQKGCRPPFSIHIMPKGATIHVEATTDFNVCLTAAYVILTAIYRFQLEQ